METHYRKAGLRATAPRSALSTRPSAVSKKCFVLIISVSIKDKKKIADKAEVMGRSGVNINHSKASHSGLLLPSSLTGLTKGVSMSKYF